MVYNLLVFGFIERRKDYKAVIDAVKDDPSYKLIISGMPRSGDLDLVRELEQHVETHTNILLIPTFVPKEAVFPQSDIIIIPYSYAFGFSGVIADAISYNKPFLASDLTVFRDITALYHFKIRVPLSSKNILDALHSLITDYDRARSELANLREIRVGKMLRAKLSKFIKRNKNEL